MSIVQAERIPNSFQFIFYLQLLGISIRNFIFTVQTIVSICSQLEFAQNDCHLNFIKFDSKMPLNKKIEILSTVELLKSFRYIRQEWRNKTPYQKWCYLYNIGKTTFKITNYPLYQIDQKLKPLSHLILALIGLVAALEIYTLHFYIIRGEFQKSFPSTCFLSGPLLAVSFQNTQFYS